MNTAHIVKVGMADLNVLAGEGLLKTTGLGSCVGLTLFDKDARVGGMAHIMLPDSRIARDGALNKAKFADTAIPELVSRMERLGASVGRMVAKMAGGAQMFAAGPNMAEWMRIGPRNVDMCRAVLSDLRIPVVAEDTGGNIGRTIELCCVTGILTVRSVNRGVKEL